MQQSRIFETRNSQAFACLGFNGSKRYLRDWELGAARRPRSFSKKEYGSSSMDWMDTHQVCVSRFLSLMTCRIQVVVGVSLSPHVSTHATGCSRTMQPLC